MIDIKTLKQLVIKVVTENPYQPINSVAQDVEKLAVSQDVFPSRKHYYRKSSYRKHYGKKMLTPADKQNINIIIWQMIRDNLLTIGDDRRN